MERVANFNDENLSVDLSRVRGRPRRTMTHSQMLNVSNSNYSDGGSLLDGAGSENSKEDLVVCTLKLLAVRDKDYKLIGLVNFEIDWHSSVNLQETVNLMERKALSF